MRVGWTHSTLARLSLLTADRTLGAIDPYRANILHRRRPGSSISSIAAGSLVMAEVLGPPGYRENAVVRGSGHRPIDAIKHDSQAVSGGLGNPSAMLLDRGID
jgi:hypothetical protein